MSPLPGPLIGPDAVADQSPRLQQIATTSPSSSWVAAPGALRDYMAVVEPWPFDVGSVAQAVTIWAPPKTTSCHRDWSITWPVSCRTPRLCTSLAPMTGS